MLGNLRAGLFKQPIDLLGDVVVEARPNKNPHEAAFFDSSNRRRALRKAASNLARVKGSSGPLSRASCIHFSSRLLLKASSIRKLSSILMRDSWVSDRKLASASFLR